MKSSKIIPVVASLLLFLMLTSCSSLDKQSEEKANPAELSSEKVAEEAVATKPDLTNTLPVQYQSPSYQVGEESKEELTQSKDVGMKVGATIKSTRGPQPLWDIMKRLAAIKGMNISWASDVDQKVLVDVDINAGDDYNEAIGNLLRQVDYFHEVSGNTIVIKYKETRQFHIAMPFVKSNYKTGTGGNVLGSDEESNNIDGTIELKSNENEFDVWKSIEANLNSILDVWTTEAVTETAEKETTNVQENPGNNEAANKEKVVSEATRLRSSNKNVYIIDKPVGMITVTAPRPLLERVDTYFKNLKRELYKQVSIEAKIIEVKLTQNSSIGINWNEVLRNFSVDGVVEFGSQALGGQVYPFIFADEEGTNGVQSIDLDGDGTSDAHTKIQDPTRFVSKVAINPQNFTAFINALQEQGDTKVLSNPKISLMNGQPGLITVGRNVTYIDNIESDLDSETGIITYTVNTERILSGIGMALTATILDDKEIILNLVPVTSELVEPIEYKDVGTLGATVGLPIVNVREMSTTVRVKNGEMLVIGGLISEIQETEGNFAPVVGNIPLFRYLFGYEEKINQKRELIILLRPVII
jgi:general secretion pathway protein D/MSHA biogenesis protein MshL